MNTETRNQRIARAIVAMKTIRRTEQGFEIIAPVFCGKEVYAAQTIIGGKCTCYKFETESDCEHTIAAELFERADRAVEYNEQEAFAPASEFRLAAQQALMSKMIEDSTAAPSWLNAFAKAETELGENKNIKFERGVLTMVSRGSGNRYVIAENDVCQCKAFEKSVPCFHLALRAILSNLSQIESSNVVEFRKPLPVKFTDDCGCIFNYDDKFTEKFCDVHRAEMMEIEAAAAYEYSFAA